MSSDQSVWGSIEVRGARENNLKNISLDIPKRRLTVFSGVSGSGKSSLVFGTIAAESQRLINETYSAFVQGFMPTLARPDVDSLEGLTTAIILDQERMGANVRSTVGTVTDANALLRILFSRRGEPHIGGPQAFSFNIPSVRGGGAITIERGAGKVESRSFSVAGGMCPRCEGMGSVTDIDVTQLYDESKSLADGAITIPGFTADGWSTRMYSEFGFFDADKPIRDFTKKELDDFLRKEPTKVQDQRHQPHLRGPDPEDPEIDAVQGCRRASTAHPGVRRPGRHLHDLPRLWRHSPQRGGAIVEDQGDQHGRCMHHADQRPRRVGPRAERALHRAADRRPRGQPGRIRRDRIGLPEPRPAVRALSRAARRSARG